MKRKKFSFVCKDYAGVLQLLNEFKGLTPDETMEISNILGLLFVVEILSFDENGYLKHLKERYKNNEV